MDNSNVLARMLDEAIKQYPDEFKSFDKTKNVQDQLQAMAFDPPNSTNLHRLIFQLNVFYDYWDTNGIPIILFTWEQLWLAFYMSEKHDKTWDGGKWKN